MNIRCNISPYSNCFLNHFSASNSSVMGGGGVAGWVGGVGTGGARVTQTGFVMFFLICDDIRIENIKVQKRVF